MHGEKKTLLSILLGAVAVGAVLGLALRKQEVSRVPATDSQPAAESVEEEVPKQQESAEETAAVHAPMTAEMLDAYMEAEYGHPTKDYLRISEEDCTSSDGYYFVNNPDQEQYLGIVASKTADFDGDGEAEAFALCLQEQDGYDDTKVLYTHLMGFCGNGIGEPVGQFTGAYALEDGTSNYIPLWDKVKEDGTQLRSFWTKMYYLNMDGESYIVVFTTREWSYFYEGYAAVYHYEQPSVGKEITRLVSAYISTDGGRTEIYFYDREERSVYSHSGAPGFTQCWKELCQALARYQIGGEVSESGLRFYFQNEEGVLIGSVWVDYDDLDAPSGYDMYLTGNKVAADETEDSGGKITVDASAGAVTLSGTLEFRSVESSSGNGMRKELYVLKLDPEIREMTLEDGTLVSQIEEIDVGLLDESVQGEYSGRPAQITGRVAENYAGGYWLNLLSIQPDEIEFLDE